MNGTLQTSSRLGVLAAALALGGCIAFAESEDFDIRPASPEQIARERAAREAYNAEGWARFDHDGDGALNRQEWRDHEWASYLISDADESGDLTLSEWVHRECGLLRLLPQGGYAGCSRVSLRRFLTATGSRHGRISQRNVRSLSDRFFRINDKNRDGVVARAEVGVRLSRRRRADHFH